MSTPHDEQEQQAAEQLIRDALGPDERLPDVRHDETIRAAAARVAAARREQLAEARRRTSLRRRWIPVAAAAMLATIAIGIVWTQRTGQQQRVALRGANHDATPAGDVSLAKRPTEFTWRAVAGAQRYRVHVFDHAALPAWVSGWSEQPRVAFPDAQTFQLKAGESYFWTVEAQGAAATAELGPFTFRITAGQ
jgi:hypothetical protein